MRLVVQRASNASVKVNEKIVGAIDFGLTVLVGFTFGDDEKTIDKMIDKLINLRIFDDNNGVMNKSLLDVGGKILSISQFTLYADTKKGRRPSYSKALSSNEAIKLYDIFNTKLKELGIMVETGLFGADMQVTLTNNGPVTIIMESELYG